MKKFNFSILFIIFLCLLNSPIISRDITKNYHESFVVKSGDILYLNHGDGNVIITSWDKDVVDVEIHFSADLHALGNGDYDFEVEFEQRENEVDISERIRNSFNFGIRGISIMRYEYLIHTPKYLKLNLKGDDGNVEIEDMAGNIDCRLSDGSLKMDHIAAGLINLNLEDGSLRMKNIEAKLDIEMDDGDITIVDYMGKCSVDIEDGQLEIDKASGHFDIQSDDGNIELRRLSVDKLQAYSNDGDIYVDIEESMVPDIDIRADDAKVSVDFNKNISAEIEIETDDGNIETDLSNPEYERIKPSYYFAEIHGSKGRIHIRTNDGDVVLREVK